MSKESETKLSQIKANKKIVLAELERRLIENEDMPRNEASVFLLNALGANCSIDGITTQKIKDAFNTLQPKDKQIFLKGMNAYYKREKVALSDFSKGNFKSIIKLPYHMVKNAIIGGTTGLQVGLAFNQIFPSFIPVNLGASINKLPEILGSLNFPLPEYVNKILQTISLFGASAIPENVYHGALLIGASLAGAEIYTIAKGSYASLKGLCKFARNKHKKHY